MTKVYYQVRATLPTAAVAAEYLDWLTHGHAGMVITGGAESAMVIAVHPSGVDDPGTEARQVISEYIFGSREQFERYEREHAPELRLDGLKRFGPDRGVSMARTLGEVAWHGMPGGRVSSYSAGA